MSSPMSPASAFARQHHAVADRQQRRFDAPVGADLGVQCADRVGIGIVMIGIANAAGP
jgi:hypothetical protein